MLRIFSKYIIVMSVVKPCLKKIVRCNILTTFFRFLFLNYSKCKLGVQSTAEFKDDMVHPRAAINKSRRRSIYSAKRDGA